MDLWKYKQELFKFSGSESYSSGLDSGRLRLLLTSVDPGSGLIRMELQDSSGLLLYSKVLSKAQISTQVLNLNEKPQTIRLGFEDYSGKLEIVLKEMEA